MSKSVFKGLKSKLNNSTKKKTEGGASETKKKIHFKGLRKFIPNMGNLTSQTRHQHYVENVDEHAADIMSKLRLLREEGSLCDITSENSRFQPAHTLVVSFNQQLLEISRTAEETVAVDMEAHNREESKTAEEISNSIETGLISHLQTSKNGEETEKPSTDEEIDCATKSSPDKEESDAEVGTSEPTESSEQTAEVTGQVCSDEQQESNDVVKTDKDVEATQGEVDAAASEEATADTDGEDLLPPLAAELKLEPSEDPTDSDKETEEITEAVSLPKFFTDPVEILINFLYTCHIDITQQNVDALRQVATKCELADVITACDEFDKVLRDETAPLESLEEKEMASKQLRYRYSDPSLPTKMLHHFDTLRQSKRHTDVVVISSGGKIRFDAHRLILATGSSLFKPLLLAEADKEHEVLEIDESVLEPLLNFLYTGKIGLTQQNVAFSMQGGDLLKRNDLVEGCAEFLEISMTVQNCIEQRRLAIEYKSEKLKEVALKFISDNFSSVVRTPGFMTLSAPGLVEIISSSELGIDAPVSTGEMAVFNAVKQWIVHDEDNRKQNLEEVMSSVRFPLIGERQLVDHVTTDLMVMSNENLCKHVTDVISSKPRRVFATDVAMRGQQCIVTLGGSYPVDDVTSKEQGYTAVGYDNHFTVFNPKGGRFHELALMGETRSLHCVAACDQFIFVAGGFDSYSCAVNTVHCFDLADGTWHTMPHLRIKRSCFTLHVIGGYLFAVGGLTPSGYTATVERLDRRGKRWEPASSIPSTRYRHAGCVLDGQILISGGYSKKDSVYSYDPDVNVWKTLLPMNKGRDSHVMLTVGHKVYAMGGEGINFSVEVLEKEKWTLLSDCSIACKQLYLPGAAVMDDKIYLLGGWENENDVAHNVRCFDPAAGCWTAEYAMPIPRGSAASCTIRIPKSYWKIKFNATKMA